MKVGAKSQRSNAFIFDYDNYDNSYKYNVNNDPWYLSSPNNGNEAIATELILLVTLLIMAVCVCCAFIVSCATGYGSIQNPLIQG